MLGSSWPTCAAFSEVLAGMGVDLSPSEWQGALFGLIAVRPRATLEDYWETLEAELGSPQEEDAPLVAHCIAMAVTALHEGGFDLPLMLPEEDAPLIVRLEALTNWCNGFLYGASLNAAVLGHPDLQEVLRDLCSITEVGLEKGVDVAIQEKDWPALEEYARQVPYYVFMTLVNTERPV